MHDKKEEAREDSFSPDGAHFLNYAMIYYANRLLIA